MVMAHRGEAGSWIVTLDTNFTLAENDKNRLNCATKTRPTTTTAAENPICPRQNDVKIIRQFSLMRNETFVGRNFLKEPFPMKLYVFGTCWAAVSPYYWFGIMSFIYLKSHVFLKALVCFVCIRFVKLTWTWKYVKIMSLVFGYVKKQNHLQFRGDWLTRPSPSLSLSCPSTVSYCAFLDEWRLTQFRTFFILFSRIFLLLFFYFGGYYV